MAIQWTDSLSVGVTEIDNQHKELFRQINVLIDACHKGKGAEAVGETLVFLDRYARMHFSTEEGYMERYQYPGLDVHRRQHQEFMDNLAEIRKRFEAEGPGVHIVVITNRILAGWLNTHIRRSDKALGDYIRGLGQAEQRG
ncbi:MAG: hemerythrin family protein [Firmicutes bacterium]|nr:hemerythrin family protein [Bacillota bacterium]HOB34254.1 bacteriohemerythrin [Bacillota bacterium]HPZ89965.1 bacteriohemerythrin [Bacillota bacterium]HQE01371.1 bacteriohemerythrin [Bacillota bacterium]